MKQLQFTHGYKTNNNIILLITSSPPKIASLSVKLGYNFCTARTSPRWGGGLFWPLGPQSSPPPDSPLPFTAKDRPFGLNEKKNDATQEGGEAQVDTREQRKGVKPGEKTSADIYPNS